MPDSRTRGAENARRLGRHQPSGVQQPLHFACEAVSTAPLVRMSPHADVDFAHEEFAEPISRHRRLRAGGISGPARAKLAA